MCQMRSGDETRPNLSGSSAILHFKCGDRCTQNTQRRFLSVLLVFSFLPPVLGGVVW